MAREVEIVVLKSTKAKLEDHSIAPLVEGEFGYATDTKELYIGKGSSNLNVSDNYTQAEIDAILENFTNKYIDTNTRNILVNALEIRALKAQDILPQSTLMVDSFDDDSNIDSESINYQINELQGYVSLQEGGNFEAKDVTEENFNLGTHFQTQTYNINTALVGKELVTQGNISVIESFDTLDNITQSSGEVIELSDDRIEGLKSLKVNVDFSDKDLYQFTDTWIDFPGGLDITNYKYLKFALKKVSDSNLGYSIYLEDNTGAYWEDWDQDFKNTTDWGSYSYLVNNITGIDKTNIIGISINITERPEGQVLVDIVGNQNNNNINLNVGDELKQTFKLAETSVCQRIKLRVRSDQTAEPSEPIIVAISDYFGTSLGIGLISPTGFNRTWQEVVVTFSTPVTLLKDLTYSISIRTEADNSHDWEIHRTASIVYPDGFCYFNGTKKYYQLNMQLLTPAIIEPILIDDLKLEQESTYYNTGTFESRIFDLGQTPSDINTLSWDRVGNNGTITFKVRFADSVAQMQGTAWSSSITVSGIDLSSITPKRYYQYQVVLDSVNTSTDYIGNVVLSYDIPSGSGVAKIISKVENTANVPSRFNALWEGLENSGTINIFISRDNKQTWQYIDSINNGSFLNFTNGTGTKVHLKAELTSGARLYSWGMICNEKFI